MRKGSGGECGTDGDKTIDLVDIPTDSCQYVSAASRNGVNFTVLLMILLTIDLALDLDPDHNLSK